MPSLMQTLSSDARVLKSTLTTLLLFALPPIAAAKPVRSTPNATVKVARVVQAQAIETPGEIHIAFLVEDHGGSTDVSPTQTLYFTLFQEGEMFSVDAAFDVGPIFSFESGRRTGPGRYEASVHVSGKNGNPEKARILIDAGAALVAMKAVRCGDEFDCAAAAGFKTEIDVTNKQP